MIEYKQLVDEYYARLEASNMKNLQVSLLRDEATELRRALRRAVANVGTEKYTEKTRLRAETHAKTLMRRLIVIHKQIGALEAKDKPRGK